MNDMRVMGHSWQKLKLSAAHIQPWDHTRAAALWALPHITDVWFAMMVDEAGETAWFTDRIDTCATDGKYMYINPVFLFKHPLEERVFICAHEVLHDIFDHCGIMYRLGKAGKVTYPDGDVLFFLPDLFNIAADCLINVILVESKVGGMPKSAWYLPKIIKSDMGVLEAYRTLYKLWVTVIQPPPKGGDEEGKDGTGGQPGDKPSDKEGKQPGGGGGSGKNPSKGGKQYIVVVPQDQQGESFDQHLEPGTGRGKTPADAEAERNPQEWEDAVNAAMISALKAGRLPANLEKIFKIHMEVPTDWRDELAIKFSQAIGREGHTWSYLDGEFALRGIGFPGRVRYGCNLVVVIADTSGSVYFNQSTMDMIMSNLAAIISQVKPKELLFGECDTEIKRWEYIQDISDLKCKVEGGGGTYFSPPFKRIDEEGLVPDCLVYLTDLENYDAYPAEPSFPVIWGSVVPDKKAPWGKTVYIPPLKDDPETL